jgi:hypothetical protein
MWLRNEITSLGDTSRYTNEEVNNQSICLPVLNLRMLGCPLSKRLEGFPSVFSIVALLDFSDNILKTQHTLVSCEL